jgi:FAD:protein FMN transferase
MEAHSASFEAIGVTNQVTVAHEPVLASALAIARAEVAALDEACSRFRDDSELARLNRTAGGAASTLLLDAVETALAAAATTGGAVDPTVGPAMRALGYDRDFDVVVRLGARATFELLPATGWRSVRVDRAAATIRMPRGTELDLGATAKALAADRIAHAVVAATGSPALVSLGGDIAVAGDPPAGGWPILITDDARAENARGQVVAIEAGGLATSSTTVRRWRAGTSELHHIVDPATGAPAAGHWRTVSVAAPTCVAANTAATAAIVRGLDAVRWLEERRLAARLVRPDGRVVYTGGWPPERTADPQPARSRAAAASGLMAS